MAAATTLAMGALSAGQAVFGGIQASNAQKELNALEVPELDSAFKDIEISTLGSDLIREENQRTISSLSDIARSGGVRGVMGSIPKLIALNNDANKEARMYLDDQMRQREYAIAQDETRIRDMKEQRYQGEVQGLGQKMMVGQQNMWSGLRGIGNSFAYADRKNRYLDE